MQNAAYEAREQFVTWMVRNAGAHADEQWRLMISLMIIIYYILAITTDNGYSMP